MSMDDPPIVPGAVKIQIRACGICGGDLKVFRGQSRKSGGGGAPLFLRGHEFSGEVVAVGAGVDHFAVGDRVAYCFGNFCGTCDACRMGRAAFCSDSDLQARAGGGFGEYCVVKAPPRGHGLHRLPDGFGWELGALAEPGTCGIGIALRARALPGDIALVYGLGTIGQIVAQCLASQGVRVIGVDVNGRKVAAASDYCEWTIDYSPALDRVKEITRGVGADVVIEAVGVPQTFLDAIEMCRLGGRFVLAGVHLRPLEGFDPDRVFRKDLTMVGAKGPMPLVNTAGEPLIFDYLRRGIVRPATLIHEFPFERAQEAFDRLASGEVVKSVIVQAPR